MLLYKILIIIIMLLVGLAVVDFFDKYNPKG